MAIPIFKVDAFTASVFGGNPAAVCPLDGWLPADVLQSMAKENNLSATAFFVRNGHGAIDLRWFTPACEVELCGHATLATASVLFREFGVEQDALRFQTKSGELVVTKRGELFVMNLPARPPAPTEVCPNLLPALAGPSPQEILAARDYVLRYRSEDEVRKLCPNMEELKQVDRFAVIVTAPGEDCDFVSRFFAPAKGIPEDPVTGSAHCTLTPYWANHFAKAELHARQISARGGELFCTLLGDRVEIAGRAALFLKGQITI